MMKRSNEIQASFNTVAIMFSSEELWVMQACVRHEMPRQEEWKFPPVSRELNRQVAEGINYCSKNKIFEYALQLSEGDCFVIDYTVRQDMKDAVGTPLGRNILLKSFDAYMQLTANLGEDAAEPANAPTARQVKELLAKQAQESSAQEPKDV